MFTGLVEEIGTVVSITAQGNGRVLIIECKEILHDIRIDASISVNGVCLTVTEFTNSTFTVTAIEETLSKTTIGLLVVGSRVNLERAMAASMRFGGHIVQGHVDCTGTVTQINSLTTSWEYFIEFPEKFAALIVHAGSICMNGISLTIAECSHHTVKVAIIPYTYNNTIISDLRIGDKVNIEFDIIGKYVERMMSLKGSFENN